MGPLHSMVGGSLANQSCGGRREKIGLSQANGNYNFKSWPFVMASLVGDTESNVHQHTYFL